MSSHAKPVALQMWTVRQQAQRDFPGTLGRIAGLGYAGVEHVHSLGYGGLSAAQVQTRMAGLGLQTAGVHISLEEWAADPEGMIAFCKELGTRYVAIAWIEPERRKDEAAYRQTARLIQPIASQCERSGLKLLYHHHDFELARFNGQYALDMLSEIVGPEHLGVEVDVHWMKRAGADPIAYLCKVGPRCPLVHFKDVTPEGLQTTDHSETRAFTPVGTGSLDFQAIAEAAPYAEWYIVEQDNCQGDPFESARISLENLRTMGLAA